MKAPSIKNAQNLKKISVLLISLVEGFDKLTVDQIKEKSPALAKKILDEVTLLGFPESAKVYSDIFSNIEKFHDEDIIPRVENILKNLYELEEEANLTLKFLE
jgi:hypothetical protein